MNKKILLRKTFSVYASDLHLATMIFPFIDKEMENGAIIKPILEKDISKNMEKIIHNVGLNSEVKNKIEQLDWAQTNIEKIKQTLDNIENILDKSNKIHIIISGSNIFINKVNKLIDLWAKMKLDDIEKSGTVINIVNCYSFEENESIENIIEKHEYMLKTTGIEEIYCKEKLKKAN